MRGKYFKAGYVYAVLAFMGMVSAATGATLTMQTNIAGPTPKIVGYNHGHYYPGSNTRDWWRYSGVSGDRIFIAPSYIEPTVAKAPWGSGVTDSNSFATAKAAARANPTNNAYFNWSYMLSKYATVGTLGSDILAPTYVLTEMQQLGIQTLVVSTASAGSFTNMSVWGDRWELWLFYYEQAFYLGSQFNVQRYQMYNEPNGAGIAQTNYLPRLQLASDAIQAAIADVNAAFGKSLVATMCAPVSAGSATSSFTSWGPLVVTNRHLNYLGQTDSNFELIQKYDYHQYGSGGNPSSFGTGLASLQNSIATTMAPEAPFPVTISEYNVYDGSDFHALSTTLDTPTNYSAFGGISVNLMKNFIDELYCFKFSQTTGSGYPAKNGMMFLDTTNVPYNIGGITKAGEVWRLINKGFAPGRNLLQFQADAGATGLDVLASCDAVGGRYYLLSVNNTASNVNLTVDFSGWGIPTNEALLVEEVSENFYGTGIAFTNLPTNRTFTGLQGSNTVRLFTVTTQPQLWKTNLAAELIQVSDGANKGHYYDPATNTPTIANNSTNAGLRSAVLLKFQIPAIDPTNIEMAVLSMGIASLNGGTNTAFVYGITNNNWSQNSATWSNAPNLAQGMAAGVAFTNNYVMGVGDLTGGIAGTNSAQLAGQLVAATPSTLVNMDVTSFLKTVSSTNPASTNVSFLMARQVNFYGDTQDGSGITVYSPSATNAIRLTLVLYPPPMVISNLTVTPRPGSAIITWATSSNATTQVQYGTTPSYGSATTLNTNLSTNHAVLLSGLLSNAVYYFAAVSTVGTNVVVASNTFSTAVSQILTSDKAFYSGTWTVDSAATDKYSSNYEYAGTTTGADTAQAVFRPNIIAAGLYDVYAWYSAGINRSQVAPATVGYQGGSIEDFLNETTNGGSWQLLTAGKNFSAGTNGYLRLGNGTGELLRVVVADAARWDYSAGQDAATNGIVPSWWSGFYYGTNVVVDSSAKGSNGYSLYANYVMGLSPVDAGSVLSLTATPTVTGFQATFAPCLNGRVYGLQSATTVVNPAWTMVSNLSVLQNTNGTGMIMVTNSGGGQKFYRLSVQMGQ